MSLPEQRLCFFCYRCFRCFLRFPTLQIRKLVGSRTRSGGREPSLSRTSVPYRVASYPYRIRIVHRISYRVASHPYRIHIVSASYRIVSRAIVSYRVVSYRHRYRIISLSLSYHIVIATVSYRTVPLSYRIRIVSVSFHEPLYRIVS